MADVNGEGQPANRKPPVRLVFHAEPRDLGFSPPPGPVTLSFVHVHERWRCLVRGATEVSTDLLVWLRDQAGFRIHTASARTASPAFELVGPPKAWSWLSEPQLHPRVTLQDDHAAKLSLVGPASRLEALADRLEDQGFTPHAPAGDPQEDAIALPGLLTQRQEQALAAAWEHGYYEIPRAIRLSDLADRLGVTAGALSTLLRRAEARLVGTYMTLSGPLLDPLRAITCLMAEPEARAWTPLGHYLAPWEREPA